MLAGHQGIQVQVPNYTTGKASYTQAAPVSAAVYLEIQKASSDQHGSCDSVVQNIIRMKQNVAAGYQGATGNESSFNFRPMNFTPPPLSEKYYNGDWTDSWDARQMLYPSFYLSHWTDAWKSQARSTSSLVDCVLSVQEQRQMDGNYSSLLPGQQQSNWGDQQQPQCPQSYQERMPFADLLGVRHSHRDSGQQQVPSFFLSEDQDQFGPSTVEAAGSQMQPACGSQHSTNTVLAR